MKVLQISHTEIQVGSMIYRFATPHDAVAFRDCAAMKNLADCIAAYTAIETRPVPPGPAPQE
jgi:hypothetical protein